MREAKLIYASSEIDSNIFYATNFLAPDPFIFIQIDDKKTIILTDLEYERGKKESKVDEILSLTEIEDRLKNSGIKEPKPVDIIADVVNQKEVKSIVVPSNFGIELADSLRTRGFQLRYKSPPFFEERRIKRADEIEKISFVQKCTEIAMTSAISLIQMSEIKDGLLYHEGKPLTAEFVRRLIIINLVENDCIARNVIVACGDQGCEPHSIGSGQLEANQTIVIDISPRSMSSGYHADLTRTIVRGKASDEVKRMYETVISAQEKAFSLIRSGADGKAIHTEVVKLFESKGYRTEISAGKRVGFIHGTGHGVGLDIHEPPRISKLGDVLRAGDVVTVEPGLYYFGIGAVRLEDLVVVEESGFKNITQYPKVLEV
jgi:Xaa-Pro aminopeptidase